MAGMKIASHLNEDGQKRYILSYSYLKQSTGLAEAARMAW